MCTGELCCAFPRGLTGALGGVWITKTQLRILLLPVSPKDGSEGE